MLLKDVSPQPPHITDFAAIIQTECQQFVKETNRPLFKQLLIEDEFKRVKNRYQAPVTESYATLLSEALSATGAHVRLERSVIASSEPGNYYVFPVDGYRYAYHPGTRNLKEHVDGLLQAVSEDLVRDVLLAQNMTTNLHEALSERIECIVYNIPYFYAVRADQIPNYPQFIERLRA